MFLGYNDHYNYNYYYYTIIASVVLVYDVEIKKLPNYKITLEQNSSKNIADHFFFVFSIFFKSSGKIHT